MKLGGIVAQANEEVIRALEDFGRSLGLAYQIIDDVIDMSQEKITNRANYALLVGRDKAMERAFQLEEESIFALKKVNINSQCLEYLTNKAVHRKT